MRKSSSGFTIVELLIVIVVIAILATISIVTYSGIQQRANNAKTLGAVTAYVKALKLYKTDNDQYPQLSSCLGTGYASNRCISDNSYVVNGGNLNTNYLSPYFNTSSSIPTPATNLGNLDGRNLGGAVYVWNSPAYGTEAGIGLYSQGASDCPSVSGLTFKSLLAYNDGSGTWCRYVLN